MKYRKMVMLAVVVIPLVVGTAMAAELTVTTQGTGKGLVIGDGIECGGDWDDCMETYPDETILHLKAFPDDWSEFRGWLVDGEPQKGSLIIRKDITVTAIFERKPQQVPEFEIVGTRPANLPDLRTKGVVPLYNSRGEIVGVQQRIWENNTVENVVLLKDGASFKIEPLNNIKVSKNKNRVIAYSGYIGSPQLISIIYVKIYSITGELIKSIETEMWSTSLYPPFCVEDNGGFWVAGIDGRTEKAFILKKYSSDGDLMWESPLPGRDLRQLRLSLDNNYAALVLYDLDTGLSEIRFYEKDGMLFYERELPRSFYSVEFIADQKVLFYSTDEWELYQLDDLENPVVTGKIRGNPFGPYPIFAVPQKDTFIIRTFDEEQSKEVARLQAVDHETGQVIAESVFKGFSSKNFQFFRVTDRGSVEVLLDSTTIIELTIPQ